MRKGPIRNVFSARRERDAVSGVDFGAGGLIWIKRDASATREKWLSWVECRQICRCESLEAQAMSFRSALDLFIFRASELVPSLAATSSIEKPSNRVARISCA